MTVRLVIRVPDHIVAAIDDLVEQGVFALRSDAVRARLVDVIDRRRVVARRGDRRQLRGGPIG
jgi:Arc/MetJ-type ribon-helix-helix transcriptional regulator